MTDLATRPRLWTSADLAALATDEHDRHEIIDGELFMSPSPHNFHQETSFLLAMALYAWARRTRSGRVVEAVTVYLSPTDEVIPDVIWIRRERVVEMVTPAGHYRGAPDLVVEVLSPGGDNLRRDREKKLRLYSRYGVEEYWIVTWPLQLIEVFRPGERGLQLAATLGTGDTLTSPLLPGFSSPVADLFPPEVLLSDLVEEVPPTPPSNGALS